MPKFQDSLHVLSKRRANCEVDPQVDVDLMKTHSLSGAIVQLSPVVLCPPRL